MGNLTGLTKLDLGGNQLTALPDWMGNLTGLTTLWLNNNQLTALPGWMGNLTGLTQLYLGGSQLTALPDWMGNLTGLTNLWLGNNQLTELPDWMGDLTGLTHLDLSGNQLTLLPDHMGDLRRLTTLDLSGNQLAGLPFSLADLPLKTLGLADNPLAPELDAAYQDSTDELLRFLRLLRDDGTFVREAKLVLVGEGAVGKSSLLAALRGEEWMEQRSTTHGINVKPLQVTADAPILLNGWDFGGQPIYRPTHQLFFTAPAVYLVVWKPREGPEQGFVEYWIRLIKHRVGDTARIHVVATHGGPLQRSAYIDEAALRDRYGDMIVAFHHVDSRTGLNIDALRAAIAATASGLPHVGRWYPESWQRLRSQLEEGSNPYLTYSAYEAIATAQGLSATSARSLAKNAHALGHWIHSADDPGLADLVIFKADWLATAISLVLDDPATIAANGLLPHRLLPGIWDNPDRDKELRYPRSVHHVFVHLMEKFDIAYRVTDGSDRLEPTSLVTQLVRTDRPDLTSAWHQYGTDREERTLICEFTESGTDVPVPPEGLMYQLIVRFHRYSLGRTDHSASVHWQHGVVLDANHHGRALITMERNRVTVTVRAAYPQFMLHQLTEDIREHVYSFWKGLDTRIKIPCGAACPQTERGNGLFDVEKIIASRQRGRPEYPCPTCDEWRDIDGLLLGTHRAATADERLTQAIRAAIQPDFTSMITTIDRQTHVVSGALDQLNTHTQRAISQAEEHLRDLIIMFDDEAREGPRLFTLGQVETTPLRPGWTRQRIRLTLWCEHSHIPVHILNGKTGPSGIYDIDVPREWLVKAAPWIKAVSVVVRSLLPVSMAGIRLDMLDPQWANIGEQLELAEKSLNSLADAASATVADGDTGNRPRATSTSSPPTRPEAGLLRTIHAIVKTHDPSYAGLERVRDRNRYLWVHRQFVNIYRVAGPYASTDHSEDT
jgi:C-terminal of Roc, COR, domain/Ras of Complex, Roc, domain of DAPkinase/Leucine rich repeat